MSQVVSKFYNVQLSPKGDEIVYRGITSQNDVVEVRQAVGDLDVMLVLIASILERSSPESTVEDAAHHVEDLELDQMDGALILTLKSPPGVRRRFRLSQRHSAGLALALRRATLQVIPSA